MWQVTCTGTWRWIAKPTLRLVTAALGNGQGAACWIAVTPNGRFASSANAATSNVCGYGIDAAGNLTLLQAQAGFTANNGALDMAVTPDGRQLHVFASRDPQQIVSFTIGKDGGLSPMAASSRPQVQVRWRTERSPFRRRAPGACPRCRGRRSQGAGTAVLLPGTIMAR
jgi:hypothetical protein